MLLLITIKGLSINILLVIFQLWSWKRSPITRIILNTVQVVTLILVSKSKLVFHRSLTILEIKFKSYNYTFYLFQNYFVHRTDLLLIYAMCMEGKNHSKCINIVVLNIINSLQYNIEYFTVAIRLYSGDKLSPLMILIQFEIFDGLKSYILFVMNG